MDFSHYDVMKDVTKFLKNMSLIKKVTVAI